MGFLARALLTSVQVLLTTSGAKVILAGGRKRPYPGDSTKTTPFLSLLAASAQDQQSSGFREWGSHVTGRRGARNSLVVVLCSRDALNSHR